MALAFRDDYWDHPALKQEFIRFVNSMFGLDLSLWDKSGFWDNNYRPFSFFEGDKLVASLCLYSMSMTVQGKDCLAGQFSAVATLPEYRRRGLSAKLMKLATEWATDTHAFFFLFANEEAFPFYERCGYRRYSEYKYHLPVVGRPAIPGLVRLDVQNAGHLGMIFRYASERAPVSSALGVNSPKLLMFWCLYGLRDHIYHVPELDLLVLLGRQGNLLTIYDLVGRDLPAFTTIYPYVGHPDDQTVNFLFLPDRLGLRDGVERIEVTENGTHLSGHFPLSDTPFIFPLTSHA